MKTTYNVAVWIIIITTAFWVSYSVIYQFIDGWHWVAISETEKILDAATKIGWDIGLTLWVISVSQLIDKIMKYKL